jgi:hypothetical protein
MSNPAQNMSCTNKCGSTTGHHSGICQKCRLIKCNKCGKTYTKRQDSTNTCAKCNHVKRKLKTEEYRYAQAGM